MLGDANRGHLDQNRKRTQTSATRQGLYPGATSADAMLIGVADDAGVWLSDNSASTNLR